MNSTLPYSYGPQNYDKINAKFDTIESEITDIEESIGDPDNPAEGSIYSELNNVKNDITEINQEIGSSTQNGTILYKLQQLDNLTTPVKYGTSNQIHYGRVTFITKIVEISVDGNGTAEVISDYTIDDPAVTLALANTGIILSFNAEPITVAPSANYYIRLNDYVISNKKFKIGKYNTSNAEVNFKVVFSAIMFHV